MIGYKRLVKLARKWQKAAGLGRRRITGSKTKKGLSFNGRQGFTTRKGHFVVYTEDGARFELPLTYLHNPNFIELLKMAEEDFGITVNGPIVLPFEGRIVNYIIYLFKRGVSQETQKALLISISRCLHCSELQGEANQQILLSGF